MLLKLLAKARESVRLVRVHLARQPRLGMAKAKDLDIRSAQVRQ